MASIPRAKLGVSTSFLLAYSSASNLIPSLYSSIPIKTKAKQKKNSIELYLTTATSGRALLGHGR